VEHAIVIASGGLDSTVLAYWLAARGTLLTMLSFDYGQRHRVELSYAAGIADLLECAHEQVDLSSLRPLLAGSALTDAEALVPDGHYTDESMRATIVPNRNAIMLDVAVAFAVIHQADAVAFGAHAGDHAIYPDCRPQFVERYAQMVRCANEGLLVEGFEILAPFLTQNKTDIVRLGIELGVPFERTWSCYRGNAVHCGTCGTCTERREAFRQNRISDPTRYEA
jgi:7-cyano-7-deazaguanine synthase